MSQIPEFGTKLPGKTYVERPGAYAFLPDPSGSHIAIVQTSNGLFLPGGGLDPGEEPRLGLAREIYEEIGYRVQSAQLILHANQYHWSGFYQSYFRKLGMFFLVEASPPPQPQCEAGHQLLWLSPEEAALQLRQEFQRWAVATWSAQAVKA